MDPRGTRALVVGAGTMGHSIAQVLAQGGMEVALTDVREDILERALVKVKNNLEHLAELGRVPQGEVPRIMARIRPSLEICEAAQGAHFALEAVSEIPELKKEVFRKLSEFCPHDCILASNTSSLDIFRIAEVSHPERFVAAHWFAPPHLIPLVEIAPGPHTSQDTLARTATLMEKLGKRPVVLKSFVPGYIVNRIQTAVSEAVMEMLENGWATPQEIDLAVKSSLGIRLPVVGVVQTMDFTGLKLILDIRRAQGKPVKIIEEKVRQGHLGASTSKGFYDYGHRSEEEILKKRDERYIRMLEHLERLGAFEPV